MKKYTTPTIEALALETIDVISISGAAAAAAALVQGDSANFQDYDINIHGDLGASLEDLTTGWKW